MFRDLSFKTLTVDSTKILKHCMPSKLWNNGWKFYFMKTWKTFRDKATKLALILMNALAIQAV
jgi:hypothetical protein